MSNLKQALDGFKRHTKMLEAMINLADQLEGVASIENAEREALNRKEKAYLDAEEAQVEAEKEKVKLAKIKEKTKTAQEVASQVISQARKEADDLIASAESQYVNKLRDAEDAKAKIKNDLKVKGEELHAVQAQITKAKAEHDAIQKRIQGMRSDVARLAGG